MVNLEKLRGELESRLLVDKELRSVVVRADSIDECLQDASVQLNARIPTLQYEVEERGSDGFLGLAQKPWVLRIYQNPQLVRKRVEEEKAAEAAAAAAEEVKRRNVDGVFYVHRFDDKIYLKVILPVGEGAPVSQGEALASVKRSDTVTLDEDLVKNLCKEGTDNEYIEVGKYKRIMSADASFDVDISKDEMQASITATAPGMGGSEISVDSIRSILRTQGVVDGFLDDKIIEFVDNPVYNVPYVVAAAIQPVNGRDAYIIYDFETDTSKMKVKEDADGQVDFKELNLIQNVVAGQRLAQKQLAEKGKAGKTIFGRFLEAKDGKDIQLALGANVRLDDDGRTVLAEKNGQVMLVNNKITVEEIYEVQGVDIKTGNITFMGTVIVKGNVDDGYNVKASGNIEVYGTVGNCVLEAEGDIVVSAGIMGRDEGVVKTSKSVWARFISNANVEAGENIVVNDSIMNANVMAMKKIIVKGKRAKIVGGHLFAQEEISAKDIGTSAGTETVLEVGYDPKAKKRLVELQEANTSLVKQLEEIDMNIATLENQKEVRRSLPKEKLEALNNFKEQKAKIVEECDDMSREISQIQEHLRELKVVGRVNASGTVYSGTKIYVRDEKDEVKADCKACSFFYENGFVRRGKYDASQVTNDVGAPEGYAG